MMVAAGAVRKRDSHLWERDPDDWYTEPCWVSERLFAAEKFDGEVVDPACGIGRIVDAGLKHGLQAYGCDKICRSPRFSETSDFLKWPADARVENLVSNPPFAHALAFAKQALIVTERKVALLLPVKWLCGDKRSRWLTTTPLRRVYCLTPRPSMPPGKVIAAGVEPGGGTVDFAWFVWDRIWHGKPEIAWLRKDT